MFPTLTDNLNLQISDNYILHWFGPDLFIYDIQNDSDQAQLSPVEADIILATNRVHQVREVWNILSQEYRISETDEGAHRLLFDFLQKLITQKVLIDGCKSIPVLGEKGKCFPMTMSIELTNRCNLKCSHCYKEALPENNTFLSTKLALNLLHQIEGKVYHIEFTGGEATLHPDFEKIVAATNIESMVLLTNGSRLTDISPEVLKRFESIQVSLYGSSQEEYQKCN